MNLQNRKNQEKTGSQEDQQDPIRFLKPSPAMHPVKPENLQGQEQRADGDES
jgi:hypothetical protein